MPRRGADIAQADVLEELDAFMPGIDAVAFSVEDRSVMVEGLDSLGKRDSLRDRVAAALFVGDMRPRVVVSVFDVLRSGLDMSSPEFNHAPRGHRDLGIVDIDWNVGLYQRERAGGPAQVARTSR